MARTLAFILCLLSAAIGAAEDLSSAYNPLPRHALTLLYAHADGTYEQTRFVADSPTRFRLVRTYSSDPFVQPVAPTVEDVYEWRGTDLFYLGTHDGYCGASTTLAPGHWWLSRLEVVGYARWQATAVTIGGWTGRWVMWHAVQDGGTVSTPLLGDVPQTLRLDQITLFDGWGDLWLERWWFTTVPGLGAVPIATEGYRVKDGQTTRLWSARLVGLWRVP